jgi:hypothetical protein
MHKRVLPVEVVLMVPDAIDGGGEWGGDRIQLES